MNLLLVEDDLRVSELVKRGLEEHGYQVTLAYDGLMGKKLMIANHYDLIITDIVLPQLNGIELCREIRLVWSELPIIMLTALGTTEDKLDGFDAGANDYLVKPFDFRELHARIKVLLSRNVGVLQAPIIKLLKYADLEMNLQTNVVCRMGEEINLTPKEFKLLEYMLRNKERILTRTEIAEKVWDTHFDTGTNFIDVYMNYLRKKIDKNFENKLIHTKTGMGFIFKEI
ncbi:two-component system response regulator [Pedobacter sp. PACM 27299]|uniref:response regulator transcription factor n=1 Tax=Pedobacter sp. PACM 27299 TaxID=1727164 RepID=UPI0007063B16|nr:response regulator transcription factor [Pedobacter sp. PACM 27299]ALL05409.1 two-component system response regulator [Pedobacter sp. PACM 27299]